MLWPQASCVLSILNAQSPTSLCLASSGLLAASSTCPVEYAACGQSLPTAALPARMHMLLVAQGVWQLWWPSKDCLQAKSFSKASSRVLASVFICWFWACVLVCNVQQDSTFLPCRHCGFAYQTCLYAICVVQGRCISYQPDWQPFPLLEVRADVIVVGPVPLMAIVKLARLIVRDAADMTAQGHYVQALVMQVCI